MRPVYSAMYRRLPVPWWAQRDSEKYHAELEFWRSRHAIDGGDFRNGHYEALTLAIAGETDDAFTAGKVVADFGCGPRGSLAWAKRAAIRIGIDALACRYFEEFTASLASHNMIYVQSSETIIPLPSSSVDILVTVNSLDHVLNLATVCDELCRILKPGGELVGSFNLEEPPNAAEPQTLTEGLLQEVLLRRFEIAHYRTGRQGPTGDNYRHLLEGDDQYQRGTRGHLWVRGRKRSSA